MAQQKIDHTHKPPNHYQVQIYDCLFNKRIISSISYNKASIKAVEDELHNGIKLAQPLRFAKPKIQSLKVIKEKNKKVYKLRMSKIKERVQELNNIQAKENYQYFMKDHRQQTSININCILHQKKNNKNQKEGKRLQLTPIIKNSNTCGDLRLKSGRTQKITHLSTTYASTHRMTEGDISKHYQKQKEANRKIKTPNELKKSFTRHGSLPLQAHHISKQDLQELDGISQAIGHNKPPIGHINIRLEESLVQWVSNNKLKTDHTQITRLQTFQ